MPQEPGGSVGATNFPMLEHISFTSAITALAEGSPARHPVSLVGNPPVATRHPHLDRPQRPPIVDALVCKGDVPSHWVNRPDVLACADCPAYLSSGFGRARKGEHGWLQLCGEGAVGGAAGCRGACGLRHSFELLQKRLSLSPDAKHVCREWAAAAAAAPSNRFALGTADRDRALPCKKGKACPHPHPLDGVGAPKLPLTKIPGAAAAAATAAAAVVTPQPASDGVGNIKGAKNTSALSLPSDKQQQQQLNKKKQIAGALDFSASAGAKAASPLFSTAGAASAAITGFLFPDAPPAAAAGSALFEPLEPGNEEDEERINAHTEGGHTPPEAAATSTVNSSGVSKSSVSGTGETPVLAATPAPAHTTAFDGGGLQLSGDMSSPYALGGHTTAAAAANSTAASAAAAAAAAVPPPTGPMFAPLSDFLGGPGNSAGAAYMRGFMPQPPPPHPLGGAGGFPMYPSPFDPMSGMGAGPMSGMGGGMYGGAGQNGRMGTYPPPYMGYGPPPQSMYAQQQQQQAAAAQQGYAMHMQMEQQHMHQQYHLQQTQQQMQQQMQQFSALQQTKPSTPPLPASPAAPADPSASSTVAAAMAIAAAISAASAAKAPAAAAAGPAAAIAAPTFAAAAPAVVPKPAAASVFLPKATGSAPPAAPTISFQYAPAPTATLTPVATATAAAAKPTQSTAAPAESAVAAIPVVSTEAAAPAASLAPAAAAAPPNKAVRKLELMMALNKVTAATPPINGGAAILAAATANSTASRHLAAVPAAPAAAAPATAVDEDDDGYSEYDDYDEEEERRKDEAAAVVAAARPVAAAAPPLSRKAAAALHAPARGVVQAAAAPPPTSAAAAAARPAAAPAHRPAAVAPASSASSSSSSAAMVAARGAPSGGGSTSTSGGAGAGGFRTGHDAAVAVNDMFEADNSVLTYWGEQIALGNGLFGTLSPSLRDNVNAAVMLAKKKKTQPCLQWDIVRMSSCSKGNTCPLLHLKKCDADWAPLGGGKCTKNKTGTCELYHFRPSMVCKSFEARGDPKDCKYGNTCTYLHVDPKALEPSRILARLTVTSGNSAGGSVLPGTLARNRAAVAAAGAGGSASHDGWSETAAGRSSGAGRGGSSAPAWQQQGGYEYSDRALPVATSMGHGGGGGGRGTPIVTTWACKVCTFAENDVLDDKCTVCGDGVRPANVEVRTDR